SASLSISPHKANCLTFFRCLTRFHREKRLWKGHDGCLCRNRSRKPLVFGRTSCVKTVRTSWAFQIKGTLSIPKNALRSLLALITSCSPKLRAQQPEPQLPFWIITSQKRAENTP